MIAKAKGQILVFEQVLIFSIGVIILIISLSLFMMYQTYYLSTTTQDQLSEVKEYVLSNIIKITSERDMNASFVLTIPKTLGGTFYKISLSNAGLNITLEPEGKAGDFSTLYGLNESFNFTGRVVSDMGKVVIYKRENWIILDTM